MKRVTPDHITELKPGQVFVFGSNYAGRHSKGAALDAREHFGATMGISEGLMGQSYAIPTKPHNVRLRLSLQQIAHHVQVFIDFARSRADLTFLVTEIGCGLAGYEPKDIAPLFESAVVLDNVWLPQRFWDVLAELSHECRVCDNCSHPRLTGLGHCVKCHISAAQTAAGPPARTPGVDSPEPLGPGPR